VIKPDVTLREAVLSETIRSIRTMSIESSASAHTIHGCIPTAGSRWLAMYGHIKCRCYLITIKIYAPSSATVNRIIECALSVGRSPLAVSSPAFLAFQRVRKMDGISVECTACRKEPRAHEIPLEYAHVRTLSSLAPFPRNGAM